MEVKNQSESYYQIKEKSNIDNHVIPLDKIIIKPIKDMTFKDIISLVFHSIIIMSKDPNNPFQEKWKLLYDEFENELEIQNELKWPKITIIKNENCKRIDVLSISKLYINSDNILTHLFRLLCVENYKRAYIYESYNYHKILNCKLNMGDNERIIKNISLNEIFTLFEIYMEYYMNIYNYPVSKSKRTSHKSKKHNKRFEYLLAKTIIKKL